MSMPRSFTSVGTCETRSFNSTAFPVQVQQRNTTYHDIPRFGSWSFQGTAHQLLRVVRIDSTFAILKYREANKFTTQSRRRTNLYAYAQIVAKPLYPASVLNKEGTRTLYFTSGYIWKEVKASPLHYVTMLSTVTSWQVAVRLSVQDQNWKRNLFQTVLSALPNSFRLHIDSLKTPKYTKIHIDTALVFAKLFSPLKEFAASYAGYAAIISFLLQASAGRTSCGSYPARSPTRWKLAEDLTWLDLDST